MVVKNIIKNVAKVLFRDDLVQAVDSISPTSEQTSDINFILMCLNFVNNTIATDYINLESEVEVDNNSGLIPFSSICQDNILDVVCVKDLFGNKLKFKVLHNGVEAPKGRVKIKYAYFPDELKLSDSFTYYNTHLTERIITYGVLSEYFYIKGNFDDASLWDSRFKQALLSSTRKLRNIVMPKREW